MEKEVIAFIVVMFLLIKWDNDRFKSNEKKKPFLPTAVKTRAEKEYNKLVRKFKSQNKRSPSKNERVTLAVKASHNIDNYKGAKGHMRRQKVRKHLVLKYNLRNKFTMSPPKRKRRN